MNKREALLQRTLIPSSHYFPASLIPARKSSSMLHFIIDYRISGFITSPCIYPLVCSPPFANVRSGVGRQSAGLHLASWSAEVRPPVPRFAGPREGGQKPATSHLFSFKGHCTGCGQMSGRLHLRILFTPRLPTDGFTKFPSLLLLPKASTYE